MSNDHQKNEEMKNRFASNDDEAESKYKEYKLVDPFPNIPPALLSSADILKYIAVTGMIFPFHPEPEKKHMKQASYGVRMIGRCIYWGENGEKHDIIIKEKDEFVLKGNSIAFVSLEPRFRIPYYIALRFNLKITHIHRGILLGTGPLVDPGFDGMLAIPLHNLTMNDYVLRGDDDLIWFDFTKINTKPFIDNLNDEAEVDDKNKLHRLEKYTEFPADKNLKDVNDYLYKAYRGHPVRSSLSEIKKVAEEAKRGTKRITWAGIISIIVLTLALILPTLMLDVPLKKWTTFSITLPVAQIQVENSSSMPSVNVSCYKNA